tara:strand:- start:109 stop:660 length:552 start_codon:yes stop_codon:yes gene_type:complete
MDPHGCVQLGLDKCIAIVNGNGCPSKGEAKDKEESNGAPSDCWSESVFIVFFFQVTSNTISGLVLFNFTTWLSFDAEYPSSRKDLGFGFRHWYLLPCALFFKFCDFEFCCFAPFILVGGFHGVIVGKSVRVLDSSSFESGMGRRCNRVRKVGCKVSIVAGVKTSFSRAIIPETRGGFSFGSAG